MSSSSQEIISEESFRAILAKHSRRGLAQLAALKVSEEKEPFSARTSQTLAELKAAAGAGSKTAREGLKKAIGIRMGEVHAQRWTTTGMSALHAAARDPRIVGELVVAAEGLTVANKSVSECILQLSCKSGSLAAFAAGLRAAGRKLPPSQLSVLLLRATETGNAEIVALLLAWQPNAVSASAVREALAHACRIQHACILFRSTDVAIPGALLNACWDYSKVIRLLLLTLATLTEKTGSDPHDNILRGMAEELVARGAITSPQSGAARIPPRRAVRREYSSRRAARREYPPAERRGENTPRRAARQEYPPSQGGVARILLPQGGATRMPSGFPLYARIASF